MIDVKETKEICCSADVENRIYHAFEVMRYLPPVKPQGYFNIFLNMKPEIIKPEDIKPVICGRDFDLAMEVCDLWWPIVSGLSDPDLLELIKYRCGAPIIKNKREVYAWSRIRPWRAVAKEFKCHRSTAKNKWCFALNFLLKRVKNSTYENSNIH